MSGLQLWSPILKTHKIEGSSSPKNIWKSAHWWNSCVNAQVVPTVHAGCRSKFTSPVCQDEWNTLCVQKAKFDQSLLIVVVLAQLIVSKLDGCFHLEQQCQSATLTQIPRNVKTTVPLGKCIRLKNLDSLDLRIVRAVRMLVPARKHATSRLGRNMPTLAQNNSLNT